MQWACYVMAGADGQPIMGMQVMEGDAIIQLNLCTAENADEVVDNFIRGLKEARADLKRQASGLIVPPKGLEVPNGFRHPQGRPSGSKGRTGQQGSRPAKG